MRALTHKGNPTMRTLKYLSYGVAAAGIVVMYVVFAAVLANVMTHVWG